MAMQEEGPKLALDPNPTPKGESEDFENADDRSARRQNDHAIKVLAMQQGPIGRLIGCSDSSLTVAFILLCFGFLALLASFAGAYMSPPVFSGYPEKIITFLLTVAGYVMGKKTSE